MKKWFIFIVCLWASQASAQGTYTAASCNRADVAAAIAAEQAHPADGDIISIPSGTCTWTGTTQLSATFKNSVTIRGQGAISATTGGSSTTGSDVTSIIDNLGSGRPGKTISLTAVAGKALRVTGIAIVMNGSSLVAANGMLNIGGTSTSVRVDHCHFLTPFGGAQGLQIGGSTQGVADHDFFESGTNNLNNPITIHNGEGWNGSTETGNAQGDHSWNDIEHWGSSQFFFIEDSRWSGGDTGDGSEAARYVFRHNTVSSDRGQMYWHGQTSGRGRGTRAAEFYNNTFSRTAAGGAPSVSVNSGTLLYWGNTSTNYRYMVGVDYTRKSNSTYPYGSPPSGWGNCDGVTVSQVWDGPSPGYPCMEQPGRGRGDLLANDFPNVVNVTQGSVLASTHQDLSPIYVWNNTFNSAGFTPEGYLNNQYPTLLTDNRDYYQQFNAAFGESGSFDGTKGVGQGLLSARPATCAAGPGGNTPGVGYWATDTNTLYVCNPTNTWTVYYTPYTYPHPLTQSSIGTVVAPPTGLVATVQ